MSLPMSWHISSRGPQTPSAVLVAGGGVDGIVARERRADLHDCVRRDEGGGEERAQSWLKCVSWSGEKERDEKLCVGGEDKEEWRAGEEEKEEARGVEGVGGEEKEAARAVGGVGGEEKAARGVGTISEV